MATTITDRSEIPDAPYYVVCVDTFLSEWGKAENKITREEKPHANPPNPF